MLMVCFLDDDDDDDDDDDNDDFDDHDDVERFKDDPGFFFCAHGAVSVLAFTDGLLLVFVFFPSLFRMCQYNINKCIKSYRYSQVTCDILVLWLSVFCDGRVIIGTKPNVSF